MKRVPHLVKIPVLTYTALIAFSRESELVQAENQPIALHNESLWLLHSILSLAKVKHNEAATVIIKDTSCP